MTPYEMMLSESQERMLMVLKPGREGEAEAIFKKWELDFAVIGEVTDTGRMELVWNGETVADIPLDPLADEAPLYDRPHMSQDEYKAWAQVKPLGEIPESADIAADLLKLMASPNIASRRWVWEQYDSQVGADTVQISGGDAAVVRVHGSNKALAMTTDCTPRYCYADPVEGGKQAVAEAYRNLCAVGARPLAITNCLNFGNPQRPEIMAQIVGCLQGMSEACIALDMPIVSGNVSLYNESKATGGGSAILPTPAIGAVGLLDDWKKSATIGFKAEGDEIWLIGTPSAHLGQSLWLREILGSKIGAAPTVDLDAERRIGEVVRRLIAEGIITAAHDVSDGGPLTAIAEMALASSFGAQMDYGAPTNASFLFGEGQGCYVVTLPSVDSAPKEFEAFSRLVADAGVERLQLGVVGGDHIRFESDAVKAEISVTLADLRAAHEGFFPKLMGSELTPEF
jgi:phosphoribosylformylglycinamidine synthase